MEIVKIGEKPCRIAAIHQIYQSFFTANVFYCTVPTIHMVTITTNLP